MASIRIINVNGQEYIQVVTYVKSGRKRKLKVLKSFGPNNFVNMTKAKVFKANYDVLESIKEEPEVNTAENMGKVEGVLGSIFGGILGYKAIKYFLDDDKDKKKK